MVRVSKISALFIILGLSLSVIHRPALAQEPIEAASTAVAAQQSPLVAEADALLLELQEGMDEAPALKAELETSEGEKRLLLTRRLSRLRLDWLSTLHELADNVLEQEKAGLDAETYRAKAEELMAVVGPRIEELVAELEESINERDLHREALTGEDLVSHEEGLSKDQQRVDTFFDALWDHISKMESLGLDATHEREFLTTELSEQAAMISERVRLAAEQKSSLAGKLRETPDNTDLQAELRAAESKQYGSLGPHRLADEAARAGHGGIPAAADRNNGPARHGDSRYESRPGAVSTVVESAEDVVRGERARRVLPNFVVLDRRRSILLPGAGCSSRRQEDRFVIEAASFATDAADYRFDRG